MRLNMDYNQVGDIQSLLPIFSIRNGVSPESLRREEGGARTWPWYVRTPSLRNLSSQHAWRVLPTPRQAPVAPVCALQRLRTPTSRPGAIEGCAVLLRMQASLESLSFYFFKAHNQNKVRREHCNLCYSRSVVLSCSISAMCHKILTSWCLPTWRSCMLLTGFSNKCKDPKWSIKGNWTPVGNRLGNPLRLAKMWIDFRQEAEKVHVAPHHEGAWEAAPTTDTGRFGLSRWKASLDSFVFLGSFLGSLHLFLFLIVDVLLQFCPVLKIHAVSISLF